MKLSKVLILSALIFGIVVTQAGATLTPYYTRAAWEAAVGGSYIEENFDSFTTATSYESSPVDVGDFTVSVSGTTFGPTWHNVGPATTVNNVNGTGQITAATGNTGGTSLDFDFSIIAFGADWHGPSDDRTSAIIVAGEILEIPNYGPFAPDGSIAPSGFFGFVADAAFVSELIVLVAGAADGFAIDNVVYARTAVPEAATIVLLFSGLLGLAGFGRKKLSK